MTEFLGKHGSEVVNMLFIEFNMEEALKVCGEEQYEIGRSEGKAASEIRIIRKKLQKNLPLFEVAEILELPESYIVQIAALIKDNPEDSDLQIAEKLLKSES